MRIKKHIPNFITCLNLLCGCLGLVVIDQIDTQTSALVYASYLIFAACVFDFLDGFIARILKVASPIGKELDSLADCVTFGVLPGFILFKLLLNHPFQMEHAEGFNRILYFSQFSFPLLIPIFSAWRLAKFNVDTRQTESFIGVPTPANGILIASFPLILMHTDSLLLIEAILNPFFIIGISIIMCYLLVAELPLFALKFKNYSWANNKIRYIFLISSVILLVVLNFSGIPIIIFLYIILSFIENKFLNKNHTKPIGFKI